MEFGNFEFSCCKWSCKFGQLGEFEGFAERGVGLGFHGGEGVGEVGCRELGVSVGWRVGVGGAGKRSRVLGGSGR